MKVQRVFGETGYLLHSRPYRETSLLIELLTKSHGRISLVARGARKPAGRKKNKPLQLFVNYEFSWYGKSELYTLTEFENHSGGALMSAHHLCCGLYINELLLRVLEREDPHPELYAAYHELMSQLFFRSPQTMASEATEISLRLFEKNLLQNLGYGFSFKDLKPELFYLFENAQGFNISLQSIRESLSGESLLALSRNQLEKKHLLDIKKLMRCALQPLIGAKPLKSRELFL